MYHGNGWLTRVEDSSLQLDPSEESRAVHLIETQAYILGVCFAASCHGFGLGLSLCLSTPSAALTPSIGNHVNRIA